MWHIWHQPQQRGVQFPLRPDARPDQSGGAPREAIADRDAQAHDMAGQDVGGPDAVRQPVYPASKIDDDHGYDNTPSKPDPQTEFGNIVEPQPVRPAATDEDDLPLPEGK